MLLHIDGFDSYTSANDLLLTYIYQSVQSFNATGGRFGKGCIYFQSTVQMLKWGSLTPLTDIWTGFAFKPSSNFTSGPLISFQTASGIEAGVYTNLALGTWSVARGDYVAALGSYTLPISPNLWAWVEVHYKISTTVGLFEVWVNGQQIINVANANTSNYGSSNFQIIVYGSTNLGWGASSTAGYIDDLYILDTTGTTNNTRLGDSRIETLVPISDAGPNNGSIISGTSHYTSVNSLPWSSSTPITLNDIPGQAETYKLSSTSVTPSKINAVKVKAIAEQSSAGSVYANTFIISNGVENDGNATLLSTNYLNTTNIFETDPNTSSDWTNSGVNNMSCGFKISQ